MTKDSVLTALPFTEEQLDKYLDDMDKHSFYIEFSDCKLKGNKLLNYIYNSGMECDLHLTDFTSNDLEGFVKDYICTDKIVNIPAVNDIWCDILLYRIEKEIFDTNKEEKEFIERFYEDHGDLIDELFDILFSLKAHLIAAIVNDDDGMIEGKESRSMNEVGLNFVTLRNSGAFWNVLTRIDSLGLPVYNYKDFQEFSYDGRKIRHNFLDEFGPFSILSIYIKDSIERAGSADE